GPLCVKIGGEHEKKAALPVLRRDLRQDAPIDVARDQLLQRAAVSQGNAAEETRHELGDDQLARPIAGPDLPQLIVIARPEESERSRNGAGADPGDDLETGPVAAFRP